MGERPAVARLQDRRLDLDEAVLVEEAPDSRHDPRPEQEELASLVVHEQVEVALPVARLLVGDAVEGVGERASILRERRELVDCERRLSPPRVCRRADDAHDVPEVDVDGPCATLVAQELDAPRAIDEIEEAELPMPPARHDSSGETALLGRLRVRLENCRLRANCRDLIPVGKALGRRHRAPSLVGRQTASCSRTIQRTQPRFLVLATVTVSTLRRRSGSGADSPPRADGARFAVVDREVVARSFLVPEDAQTKDRPRDLDRGAQVRVAPSPRARCRPSTAAQGHDEERTEDARVEEPRSEPVQNESTGERRPYARDDRDRADRAPSRAARGVGIRRALVSNGHRKRSRRLCPTPFPSGVARSRHPRRRAPRRRRAAGPRARR